mmetsp:Transcript_13769/g.50135  ORF Transcript_13769/g.50135 Transcript_13769/m.50135 type:complete len:170 (-) Transcript_13769:687-1196(-)
MSLCSRPPAPAERICEKLYALDVNGTNGNDQYVHVHPNGLGVVGVAPSHALFSEGGISAVSFSAPGKADNLKRALKATGKRKKGANNLHADSFLCIITANSGTMYQLKVCCEGKLIEVNERLVSEPCLITMDAEWRGYVAIIQLSGESRQDYARGLLSNAEYQALKGKA